MKNYLKWYVGYSEKKEDCPQEFISAKVPGSVQLDYIREKNLDDYIKGTNVKKYQWMQEKYWTYKTEYTKKDTSKKNTFLVIEGIDYEYEVFVNGKKMLSYEGMYKKNVVDITDSAKEKAEIKILVYPYPKSNLEGVHEGTRDEVNQSCKPAVSYGWDFHPRLIPLGIWNDIYVTETDYSELPKPEVHYSLSKDRKTAKVMFEGGNDKSEWTFFDTDGSELYKFTGKCGEYKVEDVKLWWCNGYGKAELYKWDMCLEDENFEGNIGFKTVELVKPEATWHELPTYPMTRNTPPICMKLNGVEVFLKGSNWVAPEIFYSEIDYNRYYEQLSLVKDANLNYIRCWGGAIVSKSFFFDICDKLGILVWQEFPLACNNYESTENYLKVLYSEAEAIIQRIKGHPSLMLWCGGNELFNSWSAMTEQSLALRTLNMLCLKETPNIPFLPTAPVMGMAHGAYSFIYKPQNIEVFKAISESKYTAYTEIGVPSVSNTDTLSLICDIKDLKISYDDELCKIHDIGHIEKGVLETYFPETEDINELIGESQYLQSIGYQFIFEEARRQKPYCSMVGNWCFNEPWPNIDNNSLLGYPNSIKPAYYKVKESCRSVLASARFKKLVYKAGEMLSFDLFLLNDSLKPIKDGNVDVLIKVGERTPQKVLSWEYGDVKINTNKVGPTVNFELPFIENAQTFEIILSCGDFSSEYTLLYRLPEVKKNAPVRMNSLDK